MNKESCQSFKDCLAGQYISQAGTATSDQVCGITEPSFWLSLAVTAFLAAACSGGTFTASPNQPACEPQPTSCQPGSFEAVVAAYNKARVCQACSHGKFSTIVNAPVSCTTWKGCNTVQLRIPGSASSDADCVGEILLSCGLGPSPASFGPLPGRTSSIQVEDISHFFKSDGTSMDYIASSAGVPGGGVLPSTMRINWSSGIGWQLAAPPSLEFRYEYFSSELHQANLVRI